MVKSLGRFSSILALLAMGGCAAVPTGPSVMVLPAPGKPFEVFQAEEGICRRWAEQQIGLSPQETANQSVATGAAVGTLVGAAAGAAIGAAAGNPATGAAIGAGSGLLVGTATGANAGQVYGYEAQRRYDHAYIQCMYAYGNQIPGTVRRTRRVRRSTPPPPPPDYEPAPQSESQPYPLPPPAQ